MASDIICLGGKEITVSLNDYAFPALLSAMKKENRSIRKGSWRNMLTMLTMNLPYHQISTCLTIITLTDEYDASCTCECKTSP